MLLPLVLTFALAQAQVTDVVIHESPSPHTDARMIPMHDDLAIDLDDRWLLLPEEGHYQAVPRPPGFLVSTHDGPMVIQVGDDEPFVHALWRLGPEGFTIERELPRDGLEHRSVQKASIDERGRVELVTALSGHWSILQETEEGWKSHPHDSGLDRSPTGKVLEVRVQDLEQLEIQLGGSRSRVPLPEATAYDPADCTETPCSITSYRFELLQRGRHAFGDDGPIIPVIQHTDEQEALCRLGYLHPCDPIDGFPNRCPQEPPWLCDGEVQTTTGLFLVDFSGARPKLVQIPGLEGQMRVFDTRAAPGGGARLLVETGGPTASRRLHLVHVGDEDPVEPRPIRYPRGGLSLSSLTPEAIYASELMLQTRSSSGLPGFEDGAMITGGSHGAGWLMAYPTEWDRSSIRATWELDLAEAGPECGLPSLALGIGRYQAVLVLSAEQSVLYSDRTGRKRTAVEVSGLGAHRWTMELDAESGEVTLYVDGGLVGTFQAERRYSDSLPHASLGTFGTCGSYTRSTEVVWRGFAVE